MYGLYHTQDCNPANRKTEIISPVVGFRCRNCGAEKDRYQETLDLLRHCKMFIVDGKGYCQTKAEKVALIKDGMERLGI